MTPQQQAAARIALKASKDLTDAEYYLQKVKPRITRAQAWGLWDGWIGLPESDVGLAPGGRTVQNVDRLDYHEAVAIGRLLSTEELPS
jgi:hypothetical protein